MPGTRQAGAVRVADEQPHAQVFFQFLDGAGQGRLVNVQALGGAGEVQFFSNGQEAPQMS